MVSHQKRNILLPLYLQPNLILKNAFIVRALSLIGIIIGALLLFNGALLAVAQYYDIQLTSEDDLFALLKDEKYTLAVKSIVGLNHFLTFIAAPFVFIFIFYKGKVIRYLQLNHFPPPLLLWFPLALFFLYPLMGFLTFYISQLELPAFMAEMDVDAMETLNSLLKMDSVGDLFINLFLIAILPGVGEELLFRGIIQKEITNRWHNPHLAIWVTAFIFGVFHFQIVGLLPKMMIGLVLGYAYYYSGSLILPMIMHALNNGFATLGYFLAGNKIEEQDAVVENIPIIPVVISVLGFIMIMTFIHNQYSPANPEINE